MSTDPPFPLDRHVRRSGDDYAQAFLALLPFGQAWPREPGSTLVNACNGLSDYWGFVDSRAADLLERESDPRHTIELLPDWERAWGLPDPCFPPGERIVEEFGDNILLGATWPIWLNAEVGVSGTTVDGLTLIETPINEAHHAKQSIAALKHGKYRASIVWKPIGPTPRGLMFSIEGGGGLDPSGADIWVYADGTVNRNETFAWGHGAAISDAKCTASSNGFWFAEFTVDISIDDKFNLCGLFLVDGDQSKYQGLDDGSGIEFNNASLRTVKQTKVPITSSIGERQRMLVLYKTWLGGQSRAYFEKLMEYVGVHITIGEFAPFMAGISRVGDTREVNMVTAEDGTITKVPYGNFRWYIGPPEMRFSWFASVGTAALTWFRAASGQAGVDPHLRIGIPEDLQCLLIRWKPAHTFLAMDFSQLAFDGPMQGTP